MPAKITHINGTPWTSHKLAEQMEMPSASAANRLKKYRDGTITADEALVENHRKAWGLGAGPREIDVKTWRAKRNHLTGRALCWAARLPTHHNYPTRTHANNNNNAVHSPH